MKQLAGLLSFTVVLLLGLLGGAQTVPNCGDGEVLPFKQTCRCPGSSNLTTCIAGQACVDNVCKTQNCDFCTACVNDANLCQDSCLLSPSAAAGTGANVGPGGENLEIFRPASPFIVLFPGVVCYVIIYLKCCSKLRSCRRCPCGKKEDNHNQTKVTPGLSGLTVTVSVVDKESFPIKACKKFTQENAKVSQFKNLEDIVQQCLSGNFPKDSKLLFAKLQRYDEKGEILYSPEHRSTDQKQASQKRQKKLIESFVDERDQNLKIVLLLKNKEYKEYKKVNKPFSEEPYYDDGGNFMWAIPYKDILTFEHARDILQSEGTHKTETTLLYLSLLSFVSGTAVELQLAKSEGYALLYGGLAGAFFIALQVLSVVSEGSWNNGKKKTPLASCENLFPAFETVLHILLALSSVFLLLSVLFVPMVNENIRHISLEGQKSLEFNVQECAVNIVPATGLVGVAPSNSADTMLLTMDLPTLNPFQGQHRYLDIVVDTDKKTTRVAVKNLFFDFFGASSGADDGANGMKIYGARGATSTNETGDARSSTQEIYNLTESLKACVLTLHVPSFKADAGMVPVPPITLLNQKNVHLQVRDVRLSNLTVDFDSDAADSKIGKITLDGVDLNYLHIKNASVLDLQINDTAIRSSGYIGAKEMHGFAKLLLRGGAKHVELVSNEASSNLICATASSIIQSTASGSNNATLLSPADSYAYSVGDGRVSIAIELEKGFYVVDVSENQCAANGPSSNDGPTTVSNDGAALSATDAERIVVRAKSFDVVSFEIGSYGVTGGTWIFSTSAAYTLFSNSYLTATSLGMLAPRQANLYARMAPNSQCPRAAGPWPSSRDELMVAASAVQPVLAKSNEAERPLVSVFFNGQNGKIYSMDDEALAIRQWSGDSLVVLALSVFLALLFLAFFLWVGLTAGISEYKRRKKRVSNRIARKSLTFHANTDPTMSMLRLAKAFIVASTIDFYEYVLLELRFNRAAERQHVSKEDVGSAGALWNRNVKRIERILIYITIAVFPSLPTLVVCWSYLQVLHTKMYVYQPMDDYVERIAYWGLVLAIAAVLNDVSSLLLSRTGTSWGTLGGICNNDRWDHPLRVLGASAQAFVRMACYCASLLVVANVGIWVLIGILINPEIAIPVATAISATIAHVVKLQGKFKSLFDRIEAGTQSLGSNANKKVGCGEDFFKTLDAQYSSIPEYAKELYKLKQNLTLGEEKINALSKLIIVPPREEEKTKPYLSKEMMIADVAGMLNKCELQTVDFPSGATDYEKVLKKMVEQGKNSSIDVKKVMEAVKDMLKVSAVFRDVPDHKETKLGKLGKWDGKDVMIDDGPKIDISGIVNIVLKSHCDDVPLDTSLILHSLAETSTKLVSLRIKEVTDELEERLLLEVKQLEKRKQENFGKQPEETKEDTGNSGELKMPITKVIKICEKHGLKGTFINSKQIIALSGHLLDFHDKVKKPPKDPKKIKLKHAIDAFKKLKEVHESLSSTDMLTAEIVGEEWDKKSRAFGLSRFQATLQVVYSVVLLILIFVLIFYAQRAFGFVGVTSGIITSLLCTGSTAAFNHLAVQNMVENKSKECERGGKIFEAVQESPRLPPGTLVPAVVASAPKPAAEVPAAPPPDPIPPVINPDSIDDKIMKEEHTRLFSKYKKSISLRTKMAAHLLLLKNRGEKQKSTIHKLNVQITEGDEKLKSLEEELKQLKKKNEELKKENEKLKKENEELKKENEEQKETIKELNVQITEGYEKVKSLEEELKQLKKENEELKKENEKLKKENEELKKENEELKKENEEQKETIKELNVRITEGDKEVKRLEEELKQLKKKNEELKKENEKQKETIKELNVRITEGDKEVKSLKEDLKQKEYALIRDRQNWEKERKQWETERAEYQVFYKKHENCKFGTKDPTPEHDEHPPSSPTAEPKTVKIDEPRLPSPPSSTEPKIGEKKLADLQKRCKLVQKHFDDYKKVDADNLGDFDDWEERIKELKNLLDYTDHGDWQGRIKKLKTLLDESAKFKEKHKNCKFGTENPTPKPAGSGDSPPGAPPPADRTLQDKCKLVEILFKKYQHGNTQPDKSRKAVQIFEDDPEIYIGDTNLIDWKKRITQLEELLDECTNEPKTVKIDEPRLPSPPSSSPNATTGDSPEAKIDKKELGDLRQKCKYAKEFLDKYPDKSRGAVSPMSDTPDSWKKRINGLDGRLTSLKKKIKIVQNFFDGYKKGNTETTRKKLMTYEHQDVWEKTIEDINYKLKEWLQLNETNKKLNQQNGDLKGRNEGLTEQNNTLKQQNNTLKQKNNDLQSDYDKFKEMHKGPNCDPKYPREPFKLFKENQVKAGKTFSGRFGNPNPSSKKNNQIISKKMQEQGVKNYEDWKMKTEGLWEEMSELFQLFPKKDRHLEEENILEQGYSCLKGLFSIHDYIECSRRPGYYPDLLEMDITELSKLCLQLKKLFKPSNQKRYDFHVPIWYEEGEANNELNDLANAIIKVFGVIVVPADPEGHPTAPCEYIDPNTTKPNRKGVTVCKAKLEKTNCNKHPMLFSETIKPRLAWWDFFQCEGVVREIDHLNHLEKNPVALLPFCNLYHMTKFSQYVREELNRARGIQNHSCGTVFWKPEYRGISVKAYNLLQEFQGQGKTLGKELATKYPELDCILQYMIKEGNGYFEPDTLKTFRHEKPVKLDETLKRNTKVRQTADECKEKCKLKINFD